MGNLFTSALNFVIRNEDGTSKLEGAEYFQYFTITILVTTVLFVLIARVYQGDIYLHAEIPEAAACSES